MRMEFSANNLQLAKNVNLLIYLILSQLRRVKSLRQCRCIHQPEAKDQRCIREGKTKSSIYIRCDMLLPISDSRKKLEGMADMIRIKSFNKKPKKKDELIQSVQSISISKVNYDMASTLSSSLAYENDISDVVGLKS